MNCSSAVGDGLNLVKMLVVHLHPGWSVHREVDVIYLMALLANLIFSGIQFVDEVVFPNFECQYYGEDFERESL